MLVGNTVSANQGAGVKILEDCAMVLTDNVISDNDGSGVHLSYADGLDARGNVISRNGGHGVGCYMTGGVEIRDCRISENGICGISSSESVVTAERCTIEHSAYYGVSGWWGAVTLYDCCIAWNSSTSVDTEDAQVRIERCTIANNSSSTGPGGIRNVSQGAWAHCSIVNSILWDNSGTVGPEIQVGPGSAASVSLQYADVEGGQASVIVNPGSGLTWGAGMIDADPLLVDAPNGDFRLRQDPAQPGIVNPCVDAGDPTSSMVPGTTRTDWVQDAGVIDMGFHAPIPVASATLRNEGTNPESYTAQTLPVLGTTLTAYVDLAGTTGHTLAVLTGFTAPATWMMPAGQTVLVDVTAPGGELLGYPSAGGPTAVFGLAVPPDPVAAGWTIFTQAAHVGGIVPFALSNAQDLVLGF